MHALGLEFGSAAQLSKQEKHHVWVQTARLYLHLICIISGIFSKTKRKPEKVAKHT